jgi:hypothetical protein
MANLLRLRNYIQLNILEESISIAEKKTSKLA